jgi:hypothetical protein
MAGMDWNQLLEDAIIGKLFNLLIEDGYRLEASDQDGGGLFIYAAEDGGTKPKVGYAHWVKLCPGNGADVIVDYTTSLELTIKPVNDFAAQFQK